MRLTFALSAFALLSSLPLRAKGETVVPCPAGTKVIELFGFDGEQLLQKRRVDARR